MHQIWSLLGEGTEIPLLTHIYCAGNLQPTLQDLHFPLAQGGAMLRTRTEQSCWRTPVFCCSTSWAVNSEKCEQLENKNITLWLQ